jgi:hypothetical protein
MNDKGFITFALVLLLPFVLTLSFASLFIVWLLNQNHSIENICFQYILESQEILVEANNSLIKLNPLAYSLIQEKRILDAIIITGPPPAKAAARLQKKIIVSKQRALSLEQKSIIQQANFQSKNQMVKLIHELNLKFNKIKLFWQNKENIKPFYKVHWVPSQVKIKIRDIASTYYRTLNHSHLQSLDLKWNINLKKIIPHWLLNYIPLHRDWEGLCDSYPTKEGVAWFPTIGKVKH